MWRIASLYRMTLPALKAANGLRSDRIYVGQKLKVSGGTGRTHVVLSGKTLETIVRRYGTTVRALQSVNRIRSHIIRPCQVLIIP